MENSGKMAVFRADMAGLGKYSMGGYGRIGVYRVMGEQIMVGMDLYCYGRKRCKALSIFITCLRCSH